ncbi:hypothetical protein Tco_1008924 [Tanacetum coccineum]
MAGSDNESDDASVHSEATIPQQQRNIQPQIITTVSNNNAKFPYLKKDEYEVIQNDNSLKRTGRDCDGRVIILPPKTADEHIAVQRESKARTTLLQSIPDDHSSELVKQKILSQLNQLKAKPEDEDINLKFLRALPSSWSHVALTLKTKGGLELLSFDALYYKLKTLEVDIQGYSTFSSSQSAGPSHSAFVGTTNACKKMSYLDCLCYSSSTYTAPSNSMTGSHRSGNIIEDVLQSFVADTEPEQQLVYEDFDQIEKLDLEEMDLKWKMAMFSVRVHKFEQKVGSKIDFDKKESARFNKKKVRCYKCNTPKLGPQDFPSDNATDADITKYLMVVKRVISDFPYVLTAQWPYFDEKEFILVVQVFPLVLPEFLLSIQVKTQAIGCSLESSYFNPHVIKSSEDPI